MSKNIVTTNCSFTLTPPSTSAVPTVTKITSSASSYVKAEGFACYFGNIDISIINYVGGNITVQEPAGAGKGTLTPSERSVKSDGNNVVLEGDSVKITVNGFKLNEAGEPVPTTQEVTVKISKAGQTTVKAE